MLTRNSSLNATLSRPFIDSNHDALSRGYLTYLVATHARKRKRERERERERERAEGGRKRGGKATDPGRERRQKRKRTCACSSRLSKYRESGILPTGKRKERKGTRAGPQKRRRRRRRGRERKSEETPVPKNGEKNSVYLVQKPYKNAHPEPTTNISSTRSGAHAPKPSRNHRVTKIELRKKAKIGRTFHMPFLGSKNGALQGPKNLPEKLRTANPKFIAKNPPRKNLRQIELCKTPRQEGSHPKKTPRKKTDSISP